MSFQRPSLDQLKARFEADINRKARIYNLTPAIPEKKEKGETYWALHTERAWEVFQMGVNAAFDAIEAQQMTIPAITTADEPLIMEWLNCGEANVDADGDVWISSPMAGHWLSADRKAEYIAWRSGYPSKEEKGG